MTCVCKTDHINEFTTDVVGRNHKIAGINFLALDEIHVFLDGCDDLSRHADFTVDGTDNRFIHDVLYVISNYEKI